jgi:predicted sulfurtransferase
MAPDAAAPDGDDVHDVVLFYAYTAIERPDAVASTLKSFFAEHAAHFKGRVLVAREGVNGTACGSRRSGALPAFQALLRELVPGCETMPYKTSLASEQVFHDARVETVRELVGWGERFEYERREKVVHLSPKEFHEALKARNGEATVLDLRNENESIVGKFRGARCPDARNMQELGRFLDSAARESSGKEVFMYCTGGIRCEKAAIYLEKKAPDVAKVYQLHGGIHEYLEAYGESDECLFLGKNFTFDKRGVMPKSGKVDCDGEVWNCQRCRDGEPKLRSCAVCVVCRFPLVLCDRCQTSTSNRGEWTCSHHANLDGVYSMYAVPHLTAEDLTARIERMKSMERELFDADPKSTANKRRTLRKCFMRMEAELARRNAGGACDVRRDVAFCRNSGRDLATCAGDCMGFWGPGHVLEKPPPTLCGGVDAASVE